MSATLLRAYRETAGDTPLLPASPAHLALLLESYLLDKACYELRYELNNRPGWIRIPLAGLRSLG